MFQYCTFIILSLSHTADVSHTFTYYDYNNINIDYLKSELCMVNWNDCWALYSVDDKLEWFVSVVYDLFTRHVSIKSVTTKGNSTPWFTTAVKSAIRDRNRFHAKWKHYRSNSNWLRYTKARNKANCVIRNAKTNYFTYKLGSANNTKQLWKNISNLCIFKKESITCQLPANDLNEHFTSYMGGCRSDQSCMVRQYCMVDKPFQFISVSEYDVASNLGKINSGAVGYDGLSIRFLKLILPYILPTITHIINHCFTTSTFPSIWKIATVTPIAKISKPMQPKDFRPISILPTLAKVCERLMAQQINEYLRTHQLLSPLQSGFRKDHSCSTAMLKILEDIRVPYDNKQFTLLCLLDFSKAFDTVNHKILCDKLKYYFHFSQNAIEFIAAYLANRRQRVRVGNEFSSFAYVKTGVPQGSTLGPLLFSLFINDIFDLCDHVRMHAFADDVQLYISGYLRDIVCIVSKLNSDLDKIHTWATENLLNLNSAKSMVLPIYSQRYTLIDIPSVVLGNTTLGLVSHVRNLGFIINSRLNSMDHINSIIPKIYNLLRILRRSAEYTPVSVRRNLALQLIIPHIRYFTLIYSKLDTVSLKKLTVVFNNVTRYVYSLRRFDHISAYSTGILGVDLVNYLEICNIIFMHKILNTNSPLYLFESISFGQSERTKQLILPKYTTLNASRMFFINAVRLWNSLPITIRLITSASTFKTAIYAYYNASPIHSP